MKKILCLLVAVFSFSASISAAASPYSIFCTGTPDEDYVAIIEKNAAGDNVIIVYLSGKELVRIEKPQYKITSINGVGQMGYEVSASDAKTSVSLSFAATASGSFRDGMLEFLGSDGIDYKNVGVSCYIPGAVER